MFSFFILSTLFFVLFFWGFCFKSKFLFALALNLRFQAHSSTFLTAAANEIGKLFSHLKLLRRNGIDIREVHVVKYQ